MFLWLNSSELNNHLIYSDWRLLSDYVPFTIDISIFKKYISTKKHIIVKNSKEKNFINKLIETIKSLNMEQISSKEILKQIVQQFADDMKWVWFKYSKNVNITK